MMKKNDLFYGFSEADLEGYVQRNLASDTLDAMEKAIPQHDELKAELMRRIHLHRIQTNLNGLLWLEQYKNQPPTPPSKGLWQSTWVKVAASISLLALLTGAYWFKTTADVQNALLAKRVEIIQKAMIALPDRKAFGDESPNGMVQQALDYYNHKQYEQAEPLFVKAIPIYPGNEEVNVYIGICRLRLGNYKEARRILEAAVSEEQSNVQLAIRWYSSLSLLAETKPEALEKARQYLQYLQATPASSEYKPVAIALLEALQNGAK
jgi:tetratricopeptide (TPR) repeat protein